jgi:hypothetical protein
VARDQEELRRSVAETKSARDGWKHKELVVSGSYNPMQASSLIGIHLLKLPVHVIDAEAGITLSSRHVTDAAHVPC